MRSCPACGCFENKKIRTINMVFPEDILLPNSYDVVVCENCGMCYSNTSASLEDYDKYYQTSSTYVGKKEFEELDEVNKSWHINRVDFVQK